MILTDEEIKKVLDEIEKQGEQSTNKADQDYLSGVQAALEWILGYGDNPMDDYR